MRNFLDALRRDETSSASSSSPNANRRSNRNRATASATATGTAENNDSNSNSNNDNDDNSPMRTILNNAQQFMNTVLGRSDQERPESNDFYEEYLRQRQANAHTYSHPRPSSFAGISFDGFNPADMAAAMRASMEQQTEPKRGPPPASQRAINQLPTIAVTPQDLQDPSNRTCVVCLDDKIHPLGSRVIRLPCAHIFHPDCVLPWLRSNCTCPICRYELQTDNDLYEIGRRQRMQSRKPRFARHELDRLSVRQLKHLLPREEKRPTFLEKLEIIDYLIQQNIIDLVPAPEPVRYRLSQLQDMSISKLVKTMEEDAGVFFYKEHVVEKQDLIQLFVNSGRLDLIEEEEEKEQDHTHQSSYNPLDYEEDEDDDRKPAARPMVETVHETDSDLGIDDNSIRQLVPEEERLDPSILMEETEMANDKNRLQMKKESSMDANGKPSVSRRTSSSPEEEPSESAGSHEPSGMETEGTSTEVNDTGLDTETSQVADAEEEVTRSDSGCDEDSPTSSRDFKRLRYSETAQGDSGQPLETDSTTVARTESVAHTHTSDTASEPVVGNGDCAAPPQPSSALEKVADRLSGMGISQLKSVAREMSVDLSDCIERQDMVDRLARADSLPSQQSGAESSMSTVSDCWPLIDEWGVSELRTFASVVDIDLSTCSNGGRDEMAQIVRESVVQRPHAGEYLRALAPLAGLSVSQLRALARDWRVDVSDCLEKGEIVHRLITKGPSSGEY